MRGLAQQVYSRFQNDDDLVLLPKYEDEYNASVGLPASSSNGETAAAAENEAVPEDDAAEVRSPRQKRRCSGGES